MDLFYGRQRSWNKFKVLEIIAHVPYKPGSTWPNAETAAELYKNQDLFTCNEWVTFATNSIETGSNLHTKEQPS
jgi:hypothetical protein